jgi:hypothetical protein
MRETSLKSDLPQQQGIRPAEESATQLPLEPTSHTGRVQTPKMALVSEIINRLEQNGWSDLENGCLGREMYRCCSKR